MLGDGEREEALGEVAQLVTRAQSGDVSAAAELLGRYRPLLAALVARQRRALAGPILADEDLWQEGYRQFLELLRTYRGTTVIGFGAYLKKMLGWRIANYVRAERRRQTSASLDGARLDHLYEELRPSLRSLEHPRIRSALSKLSPKQRGVLYQLHWQERGVSEIAAAYGLTPQAVTGLRRRAEERLRSWMEGEVRQGLPKDGDDGTD